MNTRDKKLTRPKTPKTGPSEVEREIKAFSEIRKIHKIGASINFPPDYVRSPGLVARIVRTPEEQAAYESQLFKDAEMLSIATVG